MGRHSASYIAAQGQPTGSTTSSAARYVGGVGAMALSLWAGAAIAGGGLASADDATAGTPDAAGPVKSALHSLTSGLSHALGGDSAAAGTSGVKLPKPGLFALPKSTNDGGNAFTGPLAGLAGRGSHQTTQSETTAKPSSQRNVQPNAGPSSKAAPVVSAVFGALRGGVSSPGGITFGTADPIVAKTPAASLTSFSPKTAAAQSFSPSVATVPTGFLTALNPLTNKGGTPAAPAIAVLPGALQLLRRDTTQTSLAQPLSLPSIGSLFNPTPGPAPVVAPPPTGKAYTGAGDTPSPGDTASVVLPGSGQTVVVGKYMLQSDGSVSNYGGQTYGGKTMVEPVNVIIVDPTSTTPEQATAKLNRDMTLGGFPPMAVHSGGFMGLIGGKSYGQKPALPLLAYSDNLFLLQNDHGRIFGPAPVSATGGGYVWTGAFSTETLGVSENGIPGHVYVSDDAARAALVARLVASGQVSRIDYVPLDNAVDPMDPNYTSGDHDGYAVVITLK